MQVFYSRPENKSGEKEPLWEHLVKTSKLCEEYTAQFDEGIVGRWLGIFHDAGKASEKFQAVLKKQEHNVNHAAAGAYFLRGYKQLSRVIYAHHDGLQWFIDDDLDRSMKEPCSQDTQKSKRFAVSGENEYQIALDYLRNNVELPDPKTDRPVLKKDTLSFYKNLPEMLHSRMLLSCLCDADYSASASHEDKAVLEYSEEKDIDAAHVMESLTEYREDIIKNSHSDEGLNRLRNEVYNCCLKAAEQKPGIFTLTAPTGTGKTLALLAFAAKHCEIYGKRRIIIVLPFLSIISQNAKIYRSICGDVLESHSMVSYGDSEYAKLLADKWNSPVIITTSVKFFEAFFKSQPSDLRFLHSISNSVVVFDEAQSIPAELMGTTVETMRALCETYNCTVLFSTATQPAFDLRKDIAFSAKEIINNPKKLYQSSTRVNVDWNIDNTTPLEMIAEKMSKQKSVCCVLNRKDHTHKLFELLKERCDDGGCFHISTDMCKSHRDEVIKEITTRLKDNLPCRLVSTSCIEAGVDLDFKEMYRALAPLDSIIQCAGRCNRNRNVIGKMTVFIPDEEKLYPVKYIENGALNVKLLRSRHDIDICDPEHIREYYSLMLTNNNYDHDNPKLVKAIEDHNFETVEKEYRFISNAGVNVLVPYYGESKLFDDLVKEARESGITKSWMRRAAPITVTSYREEKLKDISEECYINTCKGKHKVHGWYILSDTQFYDKMAGLCFDDDSSLEYLI